MERFSVRIEEHGLEQPPKLERPATFMLPKLPKVLDLNIGKQDSAADTENEQPSTTGNTSFFLDLVKL